MASKKLPPLKIGGITASHMDVVFDKSLLNDLVKSWWAILMDIPCKSQYAKSKPPKVRLFTTNTNRPHGHTFMSRKFSDALPVLIPLKKYEIHLESRGGVWPVALLLHELIHARGIRGHRMVLGKMFRHDVTRDELTRHLMQKHLPELVPVAH